MKNLNTNVSYELYMEIAKGLVENYEEISGHGIKVIVEGKGVSAGNYKLMDKENIAYNKVETIGTVVHVAIDNVYAGYIVISDQIKEDSAKAIKIAKKTRTIVMQNIFFALGINLFY